MADITDSVAIFSEGTFEERVQEIRTYLRTLKTHYNTDSGACRIYYQKSS